MTRILITGLLTLFIYLTASAQYNANALPGKWKVVQLKNAQGTIDATKSAKQIIAYADSVSKTSPSVTAQQKTDYITNTKKASALLKKSYLKFGKSNTITFRFYDENDNITTSKGTYKLNGDVIEVDTERLKIIKLEGNVLQIVMMENTPAQFELTLVK